MPCGGVLSKIELRRTEFLSVRYIVAADVGYLRIVYNRRDFADVRIKKAGNFARRMPAVFKHRVIQFALFFSVIAQKTRFVVCRGDNQSVAEFVRLIYDCGDCPIVCGKVAHHAVHIIGVTALVYVRFLDHKEKTVFASCA